MQENEVLETESTLESEIDAPEIEREEEHDQDSIDLERAKRLGYKTDDEYTGNPKYKLSPKEYLERAEKGGTIKKLEADVYESNRKIVEMQDAFEKMQKFNKIQVESARERALEELRARQVKAIDDGEATTSEAFDAYEREKVNVEKRFTPEPAVQSHEPPREVKDWIASNPWAIGKDALGYTAKGYEQDLLNERPDLRGNPIAILEEVKKRVIKEFPERFENPKKRVQSIEGGGTVHGGDIRKKDTFDSIGFSANDISDAKKLIKSGVYKDEAEFIKAYVLLNKGRR